MVTELVTFPVCVLHIRCGGGGCPLSPVFDFWLDMEKLSMRTTLPDLPAC